MGIEGWLFVVVGGSQLSALMPQGLGELSSRVISFLPSGESDYTTMTNVTEAKCKTVFSC